jgi:hypothetical protein
MKNFGTSALGLARHAVAGVAITGVLCSGFSASAHAEEYWRGRNHPQSHVMIRTTEWDDHGRHEHGHYHHRINHFKPVVVYPPAYYGNPSVIYVPQPAYVVTRPVPYGER